MPCDLLLAACLTIFGPGAISYSAILDDVAERRINAGWGLSEISGYEVLVAPADCRLLGKSGWLIANGPQGGLPGADNVHTAIVVDCEQKAHRGQMESRGLLVDANRVGLNHEMAWLVLR